MKHLLFFFISLFSTPLFSQIEIIDVGDGWKNKVQLAISLIKETDSTYYKHLMKNCNQIGFWAEKYSTNEGKTIFISRYDMQIESIQNIACVLIHESMHIELGKLNLPITEFEEECLCYNYERQFLEKVKDPEPRLVQNVIERMKQYKCY
jgi:hypothetical protein